MAIALSVLQYCVPVTQGATVEVFSNDPLLVDPYVLATDGTFFYIGQGPKIMRIPVAGGSVTTLYDNMTFDGISVGVNGLAINATHLFFIDPNGDVQSGGGTAIFSAIKGGGGTLSKIYSGAATGQAILDGADITTDGVKLYTTDHVAGLVHTMNFDGTGLAQVGVARYAGGFTPEHFNGIAISGSTLYIADEGKSGVNSPQIVSISSTANSSAAFTALHVGSPLITPRHITRGGDGNLYVTDSGAGNTIWKIPAGGGTPVSVVSGAPFVNIQGIVSINNTLYVSDTGNTAAGTIYKIAVTAANASPSISDITDRSINANSTTGPLAFEVTDPEADAAATLYSNVTSPLNKTYFAGNGVEFGDEVFLGGINRVITDFQFQTFLSSNASGNEKIELFIRKNDGGTSGITPGTLSYRSGELNLGPGFQIVTVPDVLINVPNPFTWSVIMTGIDAGEQAGLLLYDPPTVGASFDDFWQLEANGVWSPRLVDGGATPANFAAQAAAATTLTVVGTSDNTSLVPNSGIALSGQGSNRTVTVTPLANVSGTARITLTVSDGQGGTASDSFLVTVNAGNTAPTISVISNQTTTSGTATPAIAFTIGDAETPASSLTMTLNSSNQTLVPNGNIALGGTPANPTVTVTPASGQTGSAIIQLVVSDGTLSASSSFTLTVNAGGGTGTTPAFVTKWGSTGSGAGQFAFPQGVALDATGNVYVADRDNNRIQKFSSSGTFMSQLGSFGTGAGQFSGPRGVAVDASGDFYVADTGNHRIQKFSGSGTFRSEWGTSGSGAGQFSGPQGVALDASGNVYVTDNGNHRIQKFSNTGTFLTQWGSNGAGDGQLSFPVGVAVDASGNVYVADTANQRIQKFNSSGTFITKWGSNGSGDGQFSSPRGVAVGASDSIYVVDSDNNRMQKFSSSGTFLTKWGSIGNGDGQFSSPRGVAVDASDNIYVTDTGNNRLQKFGAGGGGTTSPVTVTFSQPVPSVFLDADYLTRIIGLFDTSGTHRWKVRLRGTGTQTVTLKVAASAVSAGEGGAIKVSITDETGPKNVEVPFPNTNGDNLQTLSLSLLGERIYDLTVDRIAPTSGAAGNHYKLGATSRAVELGYEDIRYLEPEPQVWAVNASSGEAASIDFPVDGTPEGGALPATSVTVSVTEPNGTVVLAATTRTLPATLTTTSATGGPLLVNIHSANGHFRLRKNTGSDKGVYALPQATPVLPRRLFEAQLSGANEFPPSSSTATGSGKFVLDGSELAYRVIYNSLSGPPTGAHLHGPAGSGSNADVLVGLALPAGLGTQGSFSGTLTLTGDQLTHLNSGLVYINIHSASFPGGEIRGQLIFEANGAPEISPIPNQSVFAGQTVPTIIFTVGDVETAAGSLVVEATSLNTALLPSSGIVLGGTGVDRTLNLTPVPGQLGSAQITITVRDAGSRTSTTQFTLNVVPGLNFFHADFNKNNEVPPTTSEGLGTGDFVLQGTTLRYIIDYHSLTGPVTMAHIHGPALAGANADILHPLPVDTTPGNLNNFGQLLGSLTLTTAQVTDLMAGKLYVNLHTTQFPGGEIRGQIILRATAPTQDSPPAISFIRNQRIFLGSIAPPTISFTVGDLETPAGQLILTKHSDNQTLVPDGSIVIGSGENQRSVIITPAAGQTGVASITITVEDAAGHQASSSFILRVSPTLKFFKTQLAPLTGTGGTTAPGQTSFGSGSGKFVLDGGNLRFELSYGNLSGRLTGAEIRGLALTTGGQPVVVPVTVFGEFEFSGRLFGSVAYSSDLAAQLDRGEQRFVLKTETLTGGEVDGAIVPETLLPFQDDPPVITFIPNQRVFVSTARTINFAFGDMETGTGQLVLEKHSDNLTLVPEANIVFGTGTGHQRSVTITPASGQSGQAGITIGVKDASGNLAGTFFVLRVTPAVKFFATSLAPVSGVNTPGHGGGKFVVDGGALRYEISFASLAGQVTSAEIRGPALTSGGPAVAVNLPLSGEVLVNGRIFGSVPFSSELLAQMQQGLQKVVLKTVAFPAGEVEGTITLQTTLPFEDDPPAVSFIPDQRTFVNTPRPITFWIGDLETAPGQLVVEKFSNNSTLIPIQNIVFGTGTGHERTVTITPVSGQTGQAVLAIFVQDATGNFGGISFNLRVSPVVKFFEANLTPGQEVPPTDSAGGGTGKFVLDGNTLRFDIQYGSLSGDLTQARLQGATELLSQPLITGTTIFHNSGRIIGSLPLTTSQVTELEQGRLYANLHTQQFPNGEIRGVITALANLPFEDDAPAISFIPNQRTFVNQPRNVNFVVSDLETPTDQLTVRVHSNNSALVPETPTNLGLSGSGHNRNLTINPVAGQTGEAFIFIEVEDASGNIGGQGFSLRVSPPLKFFNVTLSPVAPPVNTGGNTALTITTTVSTGQGTGKFVMDGNTLRYEIAFVGVQGRLISAEIRGSAGQLVANLPVLGQLFFSGRFFGSVAYPSEQIGQLEQGLQKIVLKTEGFPDGELGGTVMQQTVVPFEDEPPTISEIPNQRTFSSTPRTISFAIGDLETGPGQLVLEKHSDNPTLVPEGNIVFGTGTGHERTVTITPVSGQLGRAGISISVKDASDRFASSFFNLRVTPALSFFTATLNGSQETPSVTTTAQGSGKFVLDGTMLRYDIPYDSLSSGLTMAHIHGPAQAGTAAPALHPLPVPVGSLSGRLFGSVELTSAQASDLQQGRLYVNLHTANFADGEIRGQILAAAQPPFEDDPPIISLIPDQRTFVNNARTIQFAIGDLETPASQLVLEKTTSNPSLVPLNNIVFGAAAGPHDRTVTITPATDGLGESHISIGVKDGNGNQVFSFFTFRVTPALKFLSATLTGAQQVPANNSIGTGTAKFVLDVNTLRFDIVFDRLGSQFFGAQINGPAAAGAVGPLIITIGTPTQSFTQARLVGTTFLSSAQLSNFVEGRTYITLRSQQFPDGEIRGQIVQLTSPPTVDEPPFVSAIPDQTTVSGVATPALPFEIADLVTPVGELQITRQSSNPGLVPNDRITIQGFEHHQTVTVNPLEGQTGSADITVTVTDNGGHSANRIFKVRSVANVTVTFANANLEQAVRSALGKPTGEIKTLDMLNLRSLFAENRGITSLSGLEHALNLTDLDLSGNQIQNISPLAALSELDFLNLGQNPINNHAAIFGLTKLRLLGMAGTGLINLQGIGQLSQLQVLELQDNQIVNLTPLGGLTQLTFLELGNNDITDITALQTLVNLEELGLADNHIVNLGALSSLLKLNQLFLGGNLIVNVAPLATLTQLEILGLNYNLVTNFSPLSTLVRLKELGLAGLQITTIPNLNTLILLEKLNLSDNRIVNLAPLSSLTKLEELKLDGNLIVNLTPLSALANLSELDLHNNEITDTAPLAGLQHLTRVILKDNRLNVAPGTPAAQAIQSLQSRNVIVESLPQKNFAPVATPDFREGLEDVTLVLDAASLTGNDSPGPVFETGQQIIVTQVSPNSQAGGTVSFSQGTIFYTPPSNFFGTDSFAYTITDNGFSAGQPDPRSASSTVTVNVSSVNDAPNVGTVPNQQINEGSPLAFRVAATDTDASATGLTFSLLPGAPAGATINPTTGDFSWTPGESQGPLIHPISVQISDNGTPPIIITRSFSVGVTEVNTAPALAPISNQTVSEGNPMTVTASANDPDIPLNVLTFRLLGSAPAGASINPATGVFTWLPTEAQGPGIYNISIQVADNGSPSLTAVQSFSVTVTESNSPPVLATISSRSISEGSQLTFTATATDSDQPPNILSFQLGAGAPPGASIDSATGVFSWTPSEAQGPGSYNISVQVTDNSGANSVSTQNFTVTVNELNSPPSLAPISDQSIKAGETLNISASATDPDSPANVLTFSLDPGAPAGASINPTTGVITWTPPLSAEPISRVIAVRVTDNGTPNASDTKSFRVAVNASNRVPLFPAIAAQTVDEGKTLTFAAAASDTDQPPNLLSYRLGAGAPAGMSINATTGALTWTPTEAQGPSTATVSVQVTDDGIPPLSANQSVVITVNEVNSPPALAAIPNRTIRAGDPLNLTVSATDLDFPANTIRYSLSAGAPAGASINPAAGVFTWTPALAQGGTTNVITVAATDNGTPGLSDTKSFTVVVTPSNTAPVMSPIPNQAVSEGNLLTVTVIARDADLPANKLIYSLAPGAPLGIVVNPDTGVLTWTPGEPQGPSTNTVRVRVSDDGVPPLGAEQPVVIVVNELNTPPNIGTPPNQTVPEGQLLTFTVPANDPDLPPNTIQFSVGANAPSGLLINPTTGVVTWTPGELQGPSTNIITVIATDNGAPNLSTNRVVTIVVTEVNAAPVLAVIPPQAVNEGSPLTFTAVATDADLPGQVLTFGIVSGAPAGANLNPLTGVFTWTPTELQGPGTSTIRLRVADSAIPPLSAEQDVIVVVNEVNTRPNMAPIADQRVNEGGSLTFTVSAADPDVPANTIQFSLGPGAPLGMTLNPTTGVFNWTPSPAQTPSTNIINFLATDNGSPPLSTNRTATVVVFADNRPPVLTAIPPQTIAEGSELTFTARATDPDLPPQNLTFSLGQAPAGATINPATGVFIWTPAEIQGPATNIVAIRVTDSGALPQRSTNIVTIVVTEVNDAPVLRPLSNQTISAGDTISLQTAATDTDVPLNLLTFSLLPGAPAGASINPTNGLFTWTPTPAQAPSTNQVTIQVTDSGFPALSANGSFTIGVRAGLNLPPTITTIANQTTRENIPTSPIVFTIADPDTPIANLSLIASSSNTNLVPISNIEFAGSGTNRTVTIRPAPNQNGTASITIAVQENTGGRAASSFQLTVTPVGPNITREPQNVELIVGNTATFSVAATGSQSLTYQWRFNGTAISGATNSVFTIPSAQETDEGTYTVEVKNLIGSVTSADAKLTANVPLRINQQPISQSVLLNANVTFALTASGRAPLVYQWRFNGNVVPGATTPSLTLSNVDASRAGAYFAIVSNTSGSVTSIVANLEVKVQVTITQQPQSLVVLQGANATFSVQASGTPPLGYQWQLNGVDLPGQTNTVLSLAGVTPANSGEYAVVVNNPGGSTASAKATLAVSIPPSISRQPQSQSVLASDNVTFNVTVSGSEPLTYVWRLNGTPIPGATSPTLTLPNVQTANTGNYSVAVSNAAGSVISDPANLIVTGPAAIAVQPQPQTVNIGESATFIVFSSGSGPFKYQWRFNGVDIPGANQFQLTVPNVRPEDAGSYAATVSNAVGPVTSDSATLRVNIPVTITLQPQSQTVTNGSSVLFTVAAVGTPQITYQWRFNGANLPGQTSPFLAISNVRGSDAGVYSVVVGNVVGNVTSADATLGVLVPPSIQTQPASQNVPLGANVTFSVTASGDAPLSYQWQKNGGNLAGANSSTLNIANVQAADSGTYSVVVENLGGAASSSSASLSVILPPLSSGPTAQSAPPPIESAEGSFDGGSNTGSLLGQLARKSVQPTAQERWFSWKAPTGGIVTFTTAGSTFDTEMTIYTGTPPNLTEVGTDDDRGGFFNSEVRFNAVQGTTYLVKVKGFEGATGRIVVSFKLQNTTQSLPVITTTPASQTVAVGTDVAFTVTAQVQGTDLTYQWFKNDVAIPNQTSTRLNVSNVQEADAARYTVKITPTLGGTSLTVESLPAILQIGPPNTAAVDKFKNSTKLDSTGPQLNNFSLLPIKNAGGSLARGYSGSQVFTTLGASKEAGEPNHCDVVGGASQWFTYQAPNSGILRVSTEGSGFDTLLAIYTGPGTDFESLKVVECDNNSGKDGITSAISFRVTIGTIYYIAVDGVKGASGSVKLSYEFGLAPVLSQQPASQGVVLGANATLSVAVTNSLSAVTTNVPALTYQWIRDGLKLAAETSISLQLRNVQQSSVGDYAVIVSNLAGSATSSVARVTVIVPVAVTGQPQNQATKAGSRAVFSVVANGTPAILYQWRFNGVDIVGATNATYAINTVQQTDAGGYGVLVRNGGGSTPSQEASLSITQPPQITTQPANQTVVVGNPAAFTVTAEGTPTLRYQWRFNGVNLTNATESTLALNSVQAGNAGEYTVVVNNDVDSLVSAPARLAVNIPLTLTSLPRSQTVSVGSSAVFSVAANGTGPFDYQWRRDGVDIASEKTPNLVVGNVQAANAGLYSVLVSGPAGSLTSPPATLSVNAKPVITGQPLSQVVFVGKDAGFGVGATGTPPFSYQWFHNSLPIEGATNSTFTLANVVLADAGNFNVTVSNAGGSTLSELALLTVLEVISEVQFNNGAFQFRLTVPDPGGTVEFSFDLINWTPLPNGSVNGGTFALEDRDTATSSLKYYRVTLK